MRMGGVRAQGRTAHVPSEVMELVTHIRNLGTADLLAKTSRLWVDVQRHQSVRLLPGWVECDHIGQRFDRRFCREAGRRVKGLFGPGGGGGHRWPLSRPQAGGHIGGGGKGPPLGRRGPAPIPPGVYTGSDESTVRPRSLVDRRNNQALTGSAMAGIPSPVTGRDDRNMRPDLAECQALLARSPAAILGRSPVTTLKSNDLISALA